MNKEEILEAAKEGKKIEIFTATYGWIEKDKNIPFDFTKYLYRVKRYVVEKILDSK